MTGEADRGVDVVGAHEPALGLSRRAAMIVVVVGALGLLLLLRSPSTPVEVIEVPEPGQVVPRTLPDGTPVWVAAASDGDVRILEALTPGSSPVGGIVGWCTAGQRYVDPILGVSFAPDGTRYNGIVPGRLGRADDPRTGLAVRSFVVGGEARPGDPLRVGAAATPSRDVANPPLRGEQGNGPPLGCRVPRPDDPETGGGLSGLRHHGDLATTFDPSSSGWQILDAWLQVDPDGRTSLCTGQLDRPEEGAEPSPCRPVEAARLDLGLRDEAPGTVTTRIGDPIAVLMEDGVITRVAVLPTSTWSGSSLRRTRTVRLLAYGTDSTANRLVVDVPEGQRLPTCVSAAPPAARLMGGEAVIYTFADTRLEVEEAERLSAWAVSDPPLPVEVVIDEVTCRALVIRDAG